MFKLVKGSTSQLTKAIKALSSARNNAFDHSHVMACSVLAHACMHGDVRPMNLFYSILTVNEQTSLRFWLGHAIRTGKTGEPLKFSKGEFSVIENTKAERARLLKLCETRLINPDGETYKRYYDRNIVKDIQIFGDAELASALKKLLKKATGATDNVKASVDKTLIAGLSNVVNLAEAKVANQRAA